MSAGFKLSKHIITVVDNLLAFILKRANMKTSLLLPRRTLSVLVPSSPDFLILLAQKHSEGTWCGVEAVVRDLEEFSSVRRYLTMYGR